MDKKYLKTKTTISYINYNIVFRTRCNRKIFKNEIVKDLFIKETKKLCEELDINIIDINIYEYYVHLIVRVNPRYSANDVIYKIKTHTSKIIRDKVESLSKLPSLWTRDYIVTTEEVLDEELIQIFLSREKEM